ncbi:unnamed protein product [Staurois parvus]|uniref:Transposase Tc1-like domain-containing protein n=1 Tax=Staurois parvus TaxID=386267 RepID=A0ABN9AQL3_9NEOB|nr:unnamed protein product [Staurois parvus]
MIEQGQHMLKRTVCKSRQLSAESMAKDLQISSGLQISTTTMRRELHGMGFHGRTAASNPYITKCITLEQWRCVLWSDKSHFSITVFA